MKQKNKGQQIPNNITKERAERLLTIIGLIENFGWYSIDKTALAKKYGVNRSQIYDDLEMIKRYSIEVIDAPLIKVELNRMLQAAHLEVMKTLKSNSDHKVKMEAARTATGLAGEERAFLEAFGQTGGVKVEERNLEELEAEIKKVHEERAARKAANQMVEAKTDGIVTMDKA